MRICQFLWDPALADSVQALALSSVAALSAGFLLAKLQPSCICRLPSKDCKLVLSCCLQPWSDTETTVVASSCLFSFPLKRRPVFLPCHWCATYGPDESILSQMKMKAVEEAGWCFFLPVITRGLLWFTAEPPSKCTELEIMWNSSRAQGGEICLEWKGCSKTSLEVSSPIFLSKRGRKCPIKEIAMSYCVRVHSEYLNCSGCDAYSVRSKWIWNWSSKGGRQMSICWCQVFVFHFSAAEHWEIKQWNC